MYGAGAIDDEFDEVIEVEHDEDDEVFVVLVEGKSEMEEHFEEYWVYYVVGAIAVIALLIALACMIGYCIGRCRNQAKKVKAGESVPVKAAEKVAEEGATPAEPAAAGPDDEVRPNRPVNFGDPNDSKIIVGPAIGAAREAEPVNLCPVGDAPVPIATPGGPDEEMPVPPAPIQGQWQPQHQIIPSYNPPY